MEGARGKHNGAPLTFIHWAVCFISSQHHGWNEPQTKKNKPCSSFTFCVPLALCYSSRLSANYPTHQPTHIHSVSHTVIWKELFGENAITMYRSRKRSSCYACRGPSPNAYVVLACLLAYLDRYVLFVRSFLAAFSFIRFAALSVALYRLFCISLLFFSNWCVCVYANSSSTTDDRAPYPAMPCDCALNFPVRILFLCSVFFRFLFLFSVRCLMPEC